MKILIVDDDSDLTLLLTRFLSKHGFETVAAPHALEGLALLDREKIDILITDLMMPHMDGIAFVEKVRADARFTNLPVILMTAYPTDELTDTSLRKGVAMLLSKPLDFDRLLTLVRFAQ